MLLKFIITIIFIVKLLTPTQYKTLKNESDLTQPNQDTKNITIEESIQIENPIGYLSIPSINLKNNFYKFTSKHNNIEENITIIKDSKNLNNKDSVFILAAHSGSGKLAYFNNLNKLNLNDEINITYYNIEYTFIVSKIFEQPKQGYINIQKKEYSQLILTTCSPTNNEKQLIIECKIKES